MKKKTIVGMLLMLCIVAQQAAAFRVRIRVPEGSESSDSPYTWIIYVVVAVLILFGLYSYLSKLKTTFRMMLGGFRMDKKTTLNEEQQCKMLLSAIYSVQDKTLMNSIKTGMAGEERKDALDNGWKIWNHETAVSVLNELKAESKKNFVPHIAEAFKLREQQAIDKYLSDTFVLEKDAQACSQQIERAFKSIGNLVKLGIVKNEADFARIGAVGWDTSRLVYVARMCAESKYISEEEMWQYVDAADEMAHQSLTSWEDYGKSYVIGSCLWGAKGFYLKQQAGHVKKLIENPKSPWKTFPFAK